MPRMDMSRPHGLKNRASKDAYIVPWRKCIWHMHMRAGATHARTHMRAAKKPCGSKGGLAPQVRRSRIETGGLRKCLIWKGLA